MKSLINFLANPAIMFTLLAIGFFASLRIRRLWTRTPGLILAAVVLIFFVWGMADPNFSAIVSKADNIPIVAMLFLVMFFTWLSLSQGMANDDRIAAGEPVEEASQETKKVLVWPDLVYTELIALVLASVVLIAWSILVQAPIEEPANPSNSPNPSKAPWYFLGLQEMLVYFDPWIAGVLLPSLILLGLMAIPYIDINSKGSGYFTFRERPFAITVFLFGWLILWVNLIFVGTFLRGPNWNFFGPFEVWDVHKLVPLVNVNLSEYIYIKLFNRGLPDFWLIREIFGIMLLAGYYLGIPLLLTRTVFKDLYAKMSPTRYAIMVVLFLTMIALPIKMYLRWLFNLKYIVAIPEFFFNI